MSRALVSLETARSHCRIDEEDSSGGSPHDPMLSAYIRAASEAVLTYLTEPAFVDSSGEVPTDSSGEPIVPADVQQATLLLVGEFFNSREAQQEGAIDAQFGYGYLPRPVIALLFPYRVPVIA
ncbi:head-tail connector protein [Lysobacter sp. Root96]|uniref:head-tail connector protein n=1 Tax=Lysobacter sp. Root96 TaxID=1736612 RepID=UPI0006FB42A1|nr:head-tail connector protein [Lysobacter sp. Root96]KRD71443.1 hypothetical protein ASE45_06435 [Lysobacter sp. Root96]